MKTVNTNEEFLKAYDAFADAIFRHCYFRVYSREEAKDLVQDTFIRTWEYLRDGNTIENLKAFLYRVANNLIIDTSRKRKTVSLEELTDHGFQPQVKNQNPIEAKIDGEQLKKVLEQIENHYREVIIMRYIDDLSPREIAWILEETENAISVRLHRGLKKVRQLLDT